MTGVQTCALPISVTTGPDFANTVVWRFAQDGTLSAPGNIESGSITTDGSVIFANTMGAFGDVGYTYSGPEVNAYLNKSFTVNTNDRGNSFVFGADGNLVFPDGSVISQGTLLGNGAGAIGNASGDIQVYAQTSGVGIQTFDGTNYLTWFFDRNGNLTLPGNSVSINYANEIGRAHV